MSEKHQKNIQFWEIVLAVVLGLQIFQWLQEYSSEIKNFPWWTLIIAYAVISVTISQWHEKRWWRDHDKNQ